MLLKEAKYIAPEFANIFWNFKEKLKLVDFVLYGSTINNKPNPRDINILIIHSTPILDDFFKYSKRKDTSNIQKLDRLSKILNDASVIDQLSGTKTFEAIKKDTISLIYLNKTYFTNKKYEQEWKRENIWDTYLLHHLNSRSKIWDKVTNEYNIPFHIKYNMINPNSPQ